MKKINTISLFCGAGGLDIGFEKSGFKIIWGNDFNSDACETHRKWSDAEIIKGDITKISSESIPDCDIILGGFPCQGFSLAGPRKIDDSRNKLYQQYVRIIKAKKPLMFVGENVKGILTMENGKIFEAIKNDFSGCGYDVFYVLVNAKEYGVPQDRERVIIVGFHKELEIKEFEAPKKCNKIITMQETLKGLPEADKEDVCYQPFSSRYMSRNRKRNWDEVSFTIPAMAKQVPLWPGSPDMIKIDKDKWEFGKDETRRLSYKEAALIQTFPKDMEFVGNLTSKYKQIGNAVPCTLAEAFAKHLYKILNEKI